MDLFGGAVDGWQGTVCLEGPGLGGNVFHASLARTSSITVGFLLSLRRSCLAARLLCALDASLSSPSSPSSLSVYYRPA